MVVACVKPLQANDHQRKYCCSSFFFERSRNRDGQISLGYKFEKSPGSILQVDKDGRTANHCCEPSGGFCKFAWRSIMILIYHQENVSWPSRSNRADQSLWFTRKNHYLQLTFPRPVVMGHVVIAHLWCCFEEHLKPLIESPARKD